MIEEAVLKKPHKIIDDLFVETSAAKRALDAIEKLRVFGQRPDCSECMLLAGPSRVGKSAVIEHYRRQFPSFVDGRQIVRPVLVVQVDAATKVRSLIAATLRAMGDPRPDHGTAGDRTDRAMRLMESQRIQVLVYDEFQHLIDSDTDRIAYSAGDLVKSLLNAKKARILLSGVSHAERVLHTNTQLPGRARPSVYMEACDWRDPAQRLEFRVFLNEIQKQLGLPSPSSLGSLPIAHRIHHFSRGLYGYAHNLIREALIIRFIEGEVAPCLNTELLARAVDGLLLREPGTRINAFRTAPPDDYEPAPKYEFTKEPARRVRDREGANAAPF